MSDNFLFQQGESVLIAISDNIVQSGIVISRPNNLSVKVLIIDFSDFHDTPLANEKARKATGLNPIERYYTYRIIDINFLDIKTGKVKLYKIASVEQVIFEDLACDEI